MKILSTKLAILASVGILGSMLAVPAHAVLTIRITDSVSGVQTYTGVANNCGPSCTSLNVSQIDGDFNINLQIGTSNSPGGPATLHLDSIVKSVHGSVGTPNSLKIEISDTGFTFPVAPPPAFMTLNSNANAPAVGGATGTAVVNGYLDNGNVLFCQATAVCDATVGPQNFGSFGVGNDQSSAILVNPAAPYSMEIVVTSLFTNNGQAQGTFNLSMIQVPEPASVAMLGGILLFTVSAIRRRRLKA